MLPKARYPVGMRLTIYGIVVMCWWVGAFMFTLHATDSSSVLFRAATSYIPFWLHGSVYGVLGVATLWTWGRRRHITGVLFAVGYWWTAWALLLVASFFTNLAVWMIAGLFIFVAYEAFACAATIAQYIALED